MSNSVAAPADLQFIGVSGVGNSGKSALVEMLKETDSIKVFDRFFEFDFVRVTDGILDLYHHICEAWSPVRSDSAVKRFRQLAYTMGTDPKWYDVFGLARSSSQRYDRVFKNQFIAESLAYVNSFVKLTYHGIWPYDMVRLPPFPRFVRKCIRRLGYERAVHFDINVVDADDFVESTYRYLCRLYQCAFDRPYRAVVLSNAVEPYNAAWTLNVLKNTKLIVVLRDPRDIYISAVNPKKMKHGDKDLVAIENKGGSKSFLPTDDIELFVRRQRLLMEKLGDTSIEPRVLIVWFEDLILNYDQTRRNVFEFLGMDEEEHKRPKTIFKPEVSLKYICLWKNYSRQDEVRYLESELKDYLYRPAGATLP